MCLPHAQKQINQNTLVRSIYPNAFGLVDFVSITYIEDEGGVRDFSEKR